MSCKAILKAFEGLEYESFITANMGGSRCGLIFSDSIRLNWASFGMEGQTSQLEN